MASSPQKITPFLWFDNNAEEAMNHYVSIFNNSKILSVTRNGRGGPGPEGSVLVGSFELDGMQFNALNGGPMFKFNEAVSMVVHCDSQEEVDHLWARLCEGGSPSQCGWLKDKFGLSWQIVPRVFIQLVQDPDPAKSQRVMQAMMQMSKFDIAALQRAHRGE
jgi:predicted 3-demethylubiquinone-9 3-methyltransferase (glyoxalase superfamily)